MAQHIESVATSGISLATREQFMAAMIPGDIVCCWGKGDLISEGIELFTGGKGYEGPSHILKVWRPFAGGPWLTAEAQFGRGVHFGRWDDYLAYKGDLVLCRRALTPAMVQAEIELCTTLLDYTYDSVEFVSLVAQRVDRRFPLIQPPGQLYCSGLQQVLATASIPFDLPDRPWATPEQEFTESSMTAICALLEQPAA
jgi:hypothetical protein